MKEGVFRKIPKLKPLKSKYHTLPEILEANESDVEALIEARGIRVSEKEVEKYNRMDFKNLLVELGLIAWEEYDGHYMLLKFTTNWRCCFGTIYVDNPNTMVMAGGRTPEEAIRKAIIYRIDDEFVEEAGEILRQRWEERAKRLAISMGILKK
ncbi:hypothetical protein [Carboxydothermus ferrireducens]|uniref:Uncharacterized protein n=1 Tax=Carboxydothermus ferrireducens DSM 11255 TaxID=1119529 RepID=A0ABX2R990_9THEO|nr:hypothetical protein [Carboxydothermus ferrireducens]NYE57112.1 hypothetical protein [Carboxydothermus ferrireducens DSM 11255]